MENELDYSLYKAKAEKYIKASTIELMKNPENLYYGYFLTEMRRIQNFNTHSIQTHIGVKGIRMEYNPVFVVRTFEAFGVQALIECLLLDLNHLTLLHPEARPSIMAEVQGNPEAEALCELSMHIAAISYLPTTGNNVSCPMCRPGPWDEKNGHAYRHQLSEKQMVSEDDKCPACMGSGKIRSFADWARYSNESSLNGLNNYTHRMKDAHAAARHLSGMGEGAIKSAANFVRTNGIHMPKVDNDVSDVVASSIVRSTIHHLVNSKGVSKTGTGILGAFQEKITPKPISYIITLKGVLGASMGTSKELTRYRPNRRFGYAYPGKRSFPKKKYVVAIDTSGSVSCKEVQDVMGELLALKQYSSEVEVRVLMFHHNVWADLALEEFQPEEFERKFQSGGTNFDAVLERVFEGYTTADAFDPEVHLNGHQMSVGAEQRTMLVMMTDGQCSIDFDKNKVRGDVVWLLTKGGYSGYIENWDKDAQIIEIN